MPLRGLDAPQWDTGRHLESKFRQGLAASLDVSHVEQSRIDLCNVFEK